MNDYVAYVKNRGFLCKDDQFHESSNVEMLRMFPTMAMATTIARTFDEINDIEIKSLSEMIKKYSA